MQRAYTMMGLGYKGVDFNPVRYPGKASSGKGKDNRAVMARRGVGLVNVTMNGAISSTDSMDKGVNGAEL